MKTQRTTLRPEGPKMSADVRGQEDKSSKMTQNQNN